MLIEPDDRPVAQITEIEEIPVDLTEADRGGLERLLAHFTGTGLRMAFLLTRPGRGGLNAGDRRFAAQVLGVCRAADVPAEVVHVATDTVLAPVPMDELPLPASA
jgi:hypothetical protein